MWTSPVYHAFNRAPWKRRCWYHRAKDAERENRQRRLAHLKAFVLKEHRRQDVAEIEFTALAVGERNACAVLRVAMAVTACSPGGYAPGDVDETITLTMLSQRHMTFHVYDVGMRDRAGAFETVVDDVVDHGVQPEFANMLAIELYPPAPGCLKGWDACARGSTPKPWAAGPTAGR